LITRRRSYRLLLAVLVTAITYLAIVPVAIPIVQETSDKLEHILAFVALAFAVDGAFPGRPFDWTKILPLLAYGFAIEVVQLGLPNRFYDMLDVVADAVGIIAYRLALELKLRLKG
jgi:VanZ family protein